MPACVSSQSDELAQCKLTSLVNISLVLCLAFHISLRSQRSCVAQQQTNIWCVPMLVNYHDSLLPAVAVHWYVVCCSMTHFVTRSSCSLVVVYVQHLLVHNA